MHRPCDSLGSLGDGTDAKELFGEEENVVFRNDLARGILKQPRRIDPNGSTWNQ